MLAIASCKSLPALFNCNNTKRNGYLYARLFQSSVYSKVLIASMNFSSSEHKLQVFVSIINYIYKQTPAKKMLTRATKNINTKKERS